MLLRCLLTFFLAVPTLINAQLSCINWLGTPSTGSTVTIGDLDVSGNQLTVEAVFNRTAPLNNGIFYGHLVSKHTGAPNVNYALLPNGCEITTTVSGYKSTFQTCLPQINKTYHVAMVYDGSTLKFYRNGFLLSEQPCTGNIVTNDLPATIAQISNSGNPPDNQFIGFVNEVRIWNVARTQQQIRTYMNLSLPNPPSQTGLLGYYTFDNLLNKQGNAAWNGTLQGGASVNQTNTSCTLTADSCGIVQQPTVIPDFTIPDTVCVNEPVNIINNTQGATTHYWNFCAGGIDQIPTGTNLGNFGGVFSSPVFMDYVQENGNYYGFVVNYIPGKIVRLDFGNSLLNTPTAVDIGNVGGIIPIISEGIQIVKNEGKWYAIMVAGYLPGGSAPRILKIDFGTNITNTAPVGTNWGNIGNLDNPHELHIFQSGNNWHGFTVNAQNNTITRFDFSNSFDNTPTGVNLGNVGNLSYPTGIHAINDNGNWRVFIVNGGNNSRTNGTFSLTRLDFGNSLLNIPVGVNLGNPGNFLKHPRDLTILKLCGEVIGYAVNGLIGSDDIVKMDFNNDLTSVPVMTSIGNIGNLNFPHSISKIFRVNSDLFSFITNVANGTLTRLQFSGCSNSNIPNHNGPAPPPVTYNTPGTYNINLTIDDGLPTQASICKQIIVINCLTDSIIINDYTPVSNLNICTNKITVEDPSAFNVGDTVLLIQMKGATIDSTNTAAFGIISGYGNAGNYEFNYVKTINGNEIEFLNRLTRQYDIPNGKVQLIRVPYYQDLDVNSVLTCPPWDGSKGGVLVLNVSNSLNINGAINVDGKGFRGGADPFSNPAPLFCYENQFFYPQNPDLASEKGESIYSISPARSFGKGANANGGGGGNSHNSGGGGGGNGNTGGFGGYNYELTPCNTQVPFDNRGVGGKALNYSNATNKIFLGGGGGAGQSNNPEGFQAKGGNGGGIVIIKANVIVGNNNSITALGNNGLPCSGLGATGCHEGMGGGGAGGTILVQANTFSGNLNINSSGGKGGDMIVGGFGRLGPGGGGGGGITWLNSSTTPAGVSILNTGGTSGVNTNYSNDAWGATAGQTGSTILNLNLPFSNTPFRPNIDSVRIKDSLTTCTAFDFKGFGYTNANPIASWQWYFGDGQTSGTQNTSHNYAPGSYTVKLVVTDINGCKDSITRDITASLLTVNAGTDTIICSGQSVTLQGATNGGTQFQWAPSAFLNNNSVLNPVATPPAGSTTFVLTATNPIGCSITDSISVFVRAQNSFSINSPSPICRNDSVQLFAQGGDTYLWQPSAGINFTIANPFVSPTSTTTYNVQVTDTLCNFSQNLSAQVVVLSLPNVRAAKQNDINCVVSTSQLTATGASAYSWQPPATLNNPNIANPVAQPVLTTQYIVQGIDAAGCINYDSVIVNVDNTGLPGGYLMPTAFTPNNDGLNDCFGIKYWGAILELEFNIFNRWGERVFHTTDPSACWNGKFRGVEQKSDVYVYWIRARTSCEPTVFRKGVIMLIR